MSTVGGWVGGPTPPAHPPIPTTSITSPTAIHETLFIAPSSARCALHVQRALDGPPLPALSPPGYDAIDSQSPAFRIAKVSGEFSRARGARDDARPPLAPGEAGAGPAGAAPLRPRRPAERP